MRPPRFEPTRARCAAPALDDARTLHATTLVVRLRHPRWEPRPHTSCAYRAHPPAGRRHRVDGRSARPHSPTNAPHDWWAHSGFRHARARAWRHARASQRRLRSAPSAHPEARARTPARRKRRTPRARKAAHSAAVRALAVAQAALCKSPPVARAAPMQRWRTAAAQGPAPRGGLEANHLRHRLPKQPNA